jgi:excisionase family DNA binding protein
MREKSIDDQDGGRTMIPTRQPTRSSALNKNLHALTAPVDDSELAAGQVESAEDPPAAQSADPLADRFAYSVAEAALITGLSRDLLYDQMRVGKLPYLKVGRRRIITRQNLEAFLSSAES